MYRDNDTTEKRLLGKLFGKDYVRIMLGRRLEDKILNPIGYGARTWSTSSLQSGVGQG